MSAQQDTLSAQLNLILYPSTPSVSVSPQNVDAGQPVTFTISALQGDNWNSTDDFFFLDVEGSQFYQPVNSCYIKYQPFTQAVYLADDNGNFGASRHTGFRSTSEQQPMLDKPQRGISHVEWPEDCR